LQQGTFAWAHIVIIFLFAWPLLSFTTVSLQLYLSVIYSEPGFLKIHQPRVTSIRSVVVRREPFA
jgi:hypothetical protein